MNDIAGAADCFIGVFDSSEKWGGDSFAMLQSPPVTAVNNNILYVKASTNSKKLQQYLMIRCNEATTIAAVVDYPQVFCISLSDSCPHITFMSKHRVAVWSVEMLTYADGTCKNGNGK